jgi:hypothetical protein
MTRYIRLAIRDDIGDDQYADLANAVWMLLRNTPYDFHVEHDGKTAVDALNDAWTQYGNDAAWE